MGTLESGGGSSLPASLLNNGCDIQSYHRSVVVPRSLVKDVLTSLHDDPTSSHLGITKTLSKVRERYYWPDQRQDVEDWCRKCATGN